MRAYSLTHLSDDALIHGLHTLVNQDRATTAALLAHIAEVDARRLYAPAGYPSMHAYCVGELHFSGDSAYKRIQVARAGRRFPALLAAVSEGRIHMTAALLLAPHLSEENSAELIDAATHRSVSEIEGVLSGRCERGQSQLTLEAVEPQSFGPSDELDSSAVDCSQLESNPVVSPVSQEALGRHAEATGTDGRPFELPQALMLLKLAIAADTYQKLEHARALLSHAVPSGDAATIFDRALDALIARLEKRKFAATVKPRTAQASPAQASPAGSAQAQTARSRTARRTAVHDRHVPANVRRAVWERDQARCAYVSETGHRCEATRFLEFDHVDPVARGGQAAAATQMRLLCRTHNQYEAERVFGRAFMSGKRMEAQRIAAEKRIDPQEDVIAALRGLGLRAGEARRAVEKAGVPPSAPLEERLRAALRQRGGRGTHIPAPSPVPV
ncbi:MAG: hypothetical protein ACREOU_16145 [Candidatus Eiseniibacteriota bacterium]